MSLTSTAMLSHPAVYFYIYDHRMEASNCDKVSSFCGYAYHAADIPFVFANGLMQGWDVLFLLRLIFSSTIAVVFG